MILLFRPIPPFIEFCKAEKGKFSVDKVLFGQSGIDKILDNAPQIEGIGYLLRHGGEVFKDTINVMNKESLDMLGRCLGFSLEHNDLTLKAGRIFFEKFPAVPQVLFCDTAYFADLPDEASTYAVPYELRRQGARRYGGYGLIHDWVWRKTRDIRGKDLNRLISIYLGDTPNIAAIKNGKPVETTIGFTCAEGLLSSHGCGDVDPTVVFQLYSKGVSFEGIYNLLANESGFTALAGEECCYADIVAGRITRDMTKVKKILLYGIVKYVGAFVSLLGGVDALAFVVNDLKASEGFISEIRGNLDFLGLSPANIIGSNAPIPAPAEKSPGIEALCMEQSQWDITFQGVKAKIDKEM
ncbi:MAG: hypothetical protein ABH883_08320 [Candidatus Omnitrophota bacterium]